MTKLEEIEQEIKKLEAKECLTYDIVYKLATLYTVRDHMAGTAMRNATSAPSAPAMTPMMK